MIHIDFAETIDMTKLTALQDMNFDHNNIFLEDHLQFESHHKN